MAVHDEFAALAEELIGSEGRNMVFKKLSRTPADPTKPWRGASDFTTSETLKAVMTDYEAKELNQDQQILRGDLKVLVAAKTTVNDLTKFTTLIDGDQVYNIIRGRIVHPGDPAILYELQVRQ